MEGQGITAEAIYRNELIKPRKGERACKINTLGLTVLVYKKGNYR